MPSIPINLAVEDDLSEVVLRTLLARSDREYHVGTAYGHTGFGYLRTTVCGWNAAARGVPFILLTDLDEYSCPQELVSDWLETPKHPNLMFRVAVKEVESWLLADSGNLSSFLSVPLIRVPSNPDHIKDPKASLVALAAHSRSADIKGRIVPRRGTTAKQGPDYNGCLSEFVRGRWDVAAAAANSDSLRRTVDRIATFVPIWADQ